MLSRDCEDDNSVGIDEADITLGGTDDIPVYLKAGRLYVPFGNFETNMISETLKNCQGKRFELHHFIDFIQEPH